MSKDQQCKQCGKPHFEVEGGNRYCWFCGLQTDSSYTELMAKALILRDEKFTDEVYWIIGQIPSHLKKRGILVDI